LDLYKKQNALWTELSKYLRKFRQCVDDNDGRLLAQFNQSATQTHRLSSSGLEYTTQFQNFPRVYKPMFRAKEEGWYIGEADGAQLEFRVAGDLGGDSQILADLEEEIDVHSVTSSVISEAGQETDRQNAKAHTFKPLYGGQSGTEAEQAYYRHFREKYAELTAEQQRWVNRVLSRKKLTTKWGLTFYWPDTRMSRSGYVNNTPSICNYPVQSFATAEIIPIGLVYFWHSVRARGLDMRVVNTIHDSIICEVPPYEVEQFHDLSKYALIDVPYWYLKKVYGVDFSVPLGAGVALGHHWSDEEAKKSEVKYNAPRALYAQGEA
jgi:DNA polymerase I-like protein with 3'-5' exonuclease and polymerase domains